MFYRKPIFSPVEIDYLKAHRADPINQLTIQLAKSRNAIQKKLDEFDGKASTVKMSKRSKIGKREDLGISVRSGWEANVLRWLTKTNREWMYEPKVFYFEGERRGAISYLPDIYLPKEDIYLEVKGMLESKGRSAVKKFKRYYPKEFKKLRAIVGRPGTKADIFFKKMGVPILAYVNQLDKEWKGRLANWE